MFEPWYKRLFPFPLRSAFAAIHASDRGPPDQAYSYDESAFVRFEGADLDEDVNPKKRKSGAGFVGCAEFSYVQEVTTPGAMPFAVDRAGRRLTGSFLVEYDTLLIRARNLRENGIRPSETMKAIGELDAKLNTLRRDAGLGGIVVGFPARDRHL